MENGDNNNSVSPPPLEILLTSSHEKYGIYEVWKKIHDTVRVRRQQGHE